MELPQYKIEFLIKHMSLFTSRKFIIDTMTNVTLGRPVLILTADTMPTPSKSVTYIPTAAGGVRFIPPPKVATATTPMEVWRNETGLEIVPELHDAYSLIQIYRNWNTMSQEDRDASDAKSVELFGLTNTEHYQGLMENLPTTAAITAGDIVSLVFQDGGIARGCLGYVEQIADNPTHTGFTLSYLGALNERVCSEVDTFKLTTNMIPNFVTGESVTTTVGRFLINNLLLVLPFKGKPLIPYVNGPFDLGAVSKQLSAFLLSKQITVPEFKNYLNNLFFIGHFTELCVPSYSEASLTTHPDMKKRKAELIAQNKGKLDDPLVITAIEDELINLDKEYLSKDSAMRFYKPLGSKPFNICRKKMYIMVGGIEAFSKDAGQYVFMDRALSEGWDPAKLPEISNEIRRGSYSRAHETQLGGAQTKYIMRVFQDLVISEQDCGTTRGLHVDFSRVNPADYIGHYIRIGVRWVAIKQEDVKALVGTKHVMRSAMYCATKNGLCYTCIGEKFANLSVKHLTAAAIDISSTFMYSAMKNMHGSKLSVIDIASFEQFVI